VRRGIAEEDIRVAQPPISTLWILLSLRILRVLCVSAVSLVKCASVGNAQGGEGLLAPPRPGF
jgi:hypothetical protein